jgi:hypothetical protein
MTQQGEKLALNLLDVSGKALDSAFDATVYAIAKLPVKSVVQILKISKLVLKKLERGKKHTDALMVLANAAVNNNLPQEKSLNNRYKNYAHLINMTKSEIKSFLKTRYDSLIYLLLVVVLSFSYLSYATYVHDACKPTTSGKMLNLLPHNFGFGNHRKCEYIKQLHGPTTEKVKLALQGLLVPLVMSLLKPVFTAFPIFYMAAGIPEPDTQPTPRRQQR